MIDYFFHKKVKNLRVQSQKFTYDLIFLSVDGHKDVDFASNVHGVWKFNE